jgi:tol-pal system protein YbgF
MMKIPYSMLLAAALSLGLGSAGGPATAAQPGPSLEQRLERLERILRNQSLADIILQLQQLQQEVRQLRGEVELQSHTLDELSKRQRDLYLDIDQRLSNLHQAPAEPAPSGPEPAFAGAVPDSAAAAPSPTGERVVEPAPEAASPEPAPALAATPPDPKQESEAYQAAFNLLKQGRYQDSIRAFRDFLSQYPGGSYEDNAQYWLGEASYVSRDYDTALTEFTKVVERYPDSSKVAGALLKSGYIYYEKQQWQQARELFDRVNSQYPGSTEARLAEKRLERMQKEGH